MAAAIGCLTSCASEAVGSPRLLTRLAWVRSACFLSAICASNFALIKVSSSECCWMLRTRNLYIIPSNTTKVATHITRNQLVSYYGGAMEKSRNGPALFHTPLLLEAVTRK